ncbi:MAG: saccharopine dehydrogenase NADP-binding domain-containing protein [Ignavibacteriaceae bacterium]|nr:saccharopine dehydrogenase NADP-binding domain-containing protein [Ignavibacteriaceae bacterium]
MQNIVVLGAGMVGSAIASDLAKNYEITVVDLDVKNLAALKTKHHLNTISADIRNENLLKSIIKGAHLVIGAVPGYMGFNTLKAIIEAGKNVVDISFFDEDPFLLDKLAKKNNVTAIVDCGVSPGLSNIILSYYSRKMNIEKYECLVGGLPFKRTLPYEYKAPFSPIDVIEEYTRPARIVEDGKIVTKPPLSELEEIEVEQVGTLEAFNTDGLRTLLKTMSVPNMKEKTLRYPGHISLIKFLDSSGFFGKENIEVNSSNVRPIDVTAKLLFKHWKPAKDEREFTVMKINLEGEKNGKRQKISCSLFDEYHQKTGVSSMARTTGYTCTAAARLILENKFERRGICPPEFLCEVKGNYYHIIDALETKGITLKWTDK